jgi:hypothetical protein
MVLSGMIITASIGPQMDWCSAEVKQGLNSLRG